jgi:hypothetical protein
MNKTELKEKFFKQCSYDTNVVINGEPVFESIDADFIWSWIDHYILKELDTLSPSTKTEASDAVEFGKWIIENNWPDGASDEDVWLDNITGKKRTTAQLYQLFKGNPKTEQAGKEENKVAKSINYLHLYLGCDCYDHFNACKIVLTPKAYAGYMEHWTNPEDGQIKPILRPLSDMTEEEIEWLDEHDDFYDKNLSDETEPFVIIEWQAERIKYLISKHFDVFGLIEAGLAIDKTKLNNQQNVQECDATGA